MKKVFVFYEEEGAMSVFRTAVALMTAVVLIAEPGSVFAQSATTAPPNVPTEKTIGVPGAAKVEPSLIVMNAVGAILDDNKLTLTGIAPDAIIFADRPTRAAGHALTVHLLISP
jgi:hypothetical protein